MGEREDASPRHKFVIIQPHGDSHLQDPELVVGKIPRWINSAEVKGNVALFKFIHLNAHCSG